MDSAALDTVAVEVTDSTRVVVAVAADEAKRAVTRVAWSVDETNKHAGLQINQIL